MKLLFKQRFFSWFDSYDIYDENGNTVLTTLKNGITGKPEIHQPEDEGSVGYIEITDNYPAKEVTEDGETIPIFRNGEWAFE